MSAAATSVLYARLPAELHAAIAARAKALGWSITRTVTELLEGCPDLTDPVGFEPGTTYVRRRSTTPPASTLERLEALELTVPRTLEHLTYTVADLTADLAQLRAELRELRYESRGPARRPIQPPGPFGDPVLLEERAAYEAELLAAAGAGDAYAAELLEWFGPNRPYGLDPAAAAASAARDALAL